jgi:hypothetical protein
LSEATEDKFSLLPDYRAPVVAVAGGHYKVTGPLTALAIPTSLHASLLARLDRLASVREVAQIAGALGRQFSHELISAVAGMPERQLSCPLEQLVTAELSTAAEDAAVKAMGGAGVAYFSEATSNLTSTTGVRHG